MGFIKNPAKSIKNLIYHKYTVGLPDIVKRIKKTNPNNKFFNKNIDSTS